MSTFDNAKDTTAQKAEEAKSMGQEKAGQAQGTAEVWIRTSKSPSMPCLGLQQISE